MQYSRDPARLDGPRMMHVVLYPCPVGQDSRAAPLLLEAAMSHKRPSVLKKAVGVSTAH
ncbi:MAG: hypothetical protein JWO59_561 [Chloroflexi bacterium]|nr:hypothetical protein [Chloroflexota bacterium]